MKRKASPKYRLRHKQAKTLYVAERAGDWARWESKGYALRRTKKWWLTKLQPGWKEYLVLELVK